MLELVTEEIAGWRHGRVATQHLFVTTALTSHLAVVAELSLSVTAVVMTHHEVFSAGHG